MFSCSYDDEADKVNQYQRLNLDGLEKIEIGKTLESESRSEDFLCSLSHPTLPESALDSFSASIYPRPFFKFIFNKNK